MEKGKARPRCCELSKKDFRDEYQKKKRRGKGAIENATVGGELLDAGRWGRASSAEGRKVAKSGKRDYRGKKKESGILGTGDWKESMEGRRGAVK